MRILALFPALALAACSSIPTNEPSLARRPAEAIDPRLPVTVEPSNAPADAATDARISDLLASARAGARAFDEAVPRVRSLADRAGPAQSESWIAAQLALSELDRHRAAGVTAASDLDALRSQQLRSGHVALAAELELYEAAAAELREINERMAAAYRSIADNLAD
jgi:hypothetical protein